MTIAYQYCTGPVWIYVAINSQTGYVMSPPSPSAAVLLGTCEQYPLVRGVQHWEPTYNDIAGPVPFDKQYFGDSKVLVMDINKMVQVNITEIIGTGATEDAISRGLYKNLTANLSATFTVWLVFSNYGVPGMPAGLPPGEVYFNCNMSESGYDPIGTRSRKTRIVVEADPAYCATQAIDEGPRGFITYSLDPVWFVGLPRAADA